MSPRSRAVNIYRHYQDGGLIRETQFENDDGKVALVDCMPVNEENTSIIRLVMGRKGRVAMKTDLVIRVDCGLSVPWGNHLDQETWTAVAGPMLVLRTPVTLHGRDMHRAGRFTVKEGQVIPFVLTYVPSHLEPAPPFPDVNILHRRMAAFWRDWSRRCRFSGKWSRYVRRSLITLKGLSFQATGGIVAAPTTSLPEQIGGIRNWDYRFCWLRDASFSCWHF